MLRPHLTFAALIALLPLSARGQSSASTNRPVASAAGAFFALSVSDLQASTRWYVEKLGLRVVRSIPPNGGTAVAILEGGGLIVELLQHDEAMPLNRAAPAVKGTQYVHGIVKAGLIVDDFDRTLAQLRGRGAEIAYGPYPARPDQRANVIVRDNAGNLIQFFGK